MANNSQQNVTKNEFNKSNDQTVEVLYQKLGNRWFAFSLIDEEVFVGSISQDEIDQMALENNNNAPALPGPTIGNS